MIDPFIYCNNPKSKYAISFPQRGFAKCNPLSGTSISVNTSLLNSSEKTYGPPDGSRLVDRVTYNCVLNTSESGLFKKWLLTDSPIKEEKAVANSIEKAFPVLKTNIINKDEYNTKVVLLYKKIMFGSVGSYSYLSDDSYDIFWDVSRDPEEQRVSYTVYLTDYRFYDGSHENYTTYSIGVSAPFTAAKKTDIPDLTFWGIK